MSNRDSTRTIKIAKVEASCGCLRRTLASEVLKPGESTQLSLEINTLTQPDGPNRWQVVVQYTIEQSGGAFATPAGDRQLFLMTMANLSHEVTLSPAQIGFSSTGEATQTLTITDSRVKKKPLTVLRAVPSSNHLSAEVAAPVTVADGKRSQTVTIKLAANAPVGHRDESITLLTDDPAYPEFRVPVRILKRSPGAVEATPDAIRVRAVGARMESATLVQIRAGNDANVSIGTAESDNPGVSVKWSSGSGPVATMRVTISAEASSNEGSCKVRVRMTEPAGQELLIPVTWTK